MEKIKVNYHQTGATLLYDVNEKTIEEAINDFTASGNINTNIISDGYHTFGELYEHRIELFITVCKFQYRKFVNHETDLNPWRTQPVNGWFVLGVGREKGEQITYHLPESKLSEVVNIAIQMSPLGDNYDGHTSNDVLNRLKKLV